MVGGRQNIRFDDVYFSHPPEKNSSQNHHTAEKLSHGEEAKKKTNLGVGLSYEFDQDAKDTIADKEERQH